MTYFLLAKSLSQAFITGNATVVVEAYDSEVLSTIVFGIAIDVVNLNVEIPISANAAGVQIVGH